MLTLQAEIQLCCPSCGQFIDFQDTVDISNKNSLSCPHCNDVLYLSMTCLLLNVAYIRSNAAALAEVALAENEFLTEIDAEIASERNQPAAGQ